MRALTTPSAAPGGSLASELSRAVEQRGVSVHWLHRALARRGIQVDPATLIGWRTGRLVPGAEAIPAVTALESLLELDPGQLTHRVATEEVYALSDGIQRALAALGLEGPPSLVERRLSIHLQVDEHGAQCRVTRGSTWVGRRPGARGFPVVTILPPPVLQRPVVTPLAGCSEGPHYTDLAEGVFATALLLDTPMEEGGTAETAHQVDLAGAPGDVSFEHHLRDPVEEVALTVGFHPERVPGLVHTYTVSGSGGRESTRSVPVVGTSVTHALRGFGPGVVGVRWQW